MGVIKQFAQSCIDTMETKQLVDMLLDRFSGMEGVNDIPTDKMIHLSNVLECEHVNRLQQVYTYMGDPDEWDGN
jgi:hypothetical protein